MIISGILRQNDEAVAFGKVFLSDENGNYIDGANSFTTDETGSYEIFVSPNEADQYLTFQSFSGKKTIPYSSFNCGSDVCKLDIDLADTFLPQLQVIAFKSFWEKWKYYIVSALLLLIIIFVVYKIRK